MKLSNKTNFFLILILLAMAISPAFALGDGNRNLFLIGVMGFAPFIILRYPLFTKNDLLLMLFMVAIILAPLLFHPETMRWSTVLYSIMFCLTFMAYSRLLYFGSFTIFSYLKLLKYLILAYFIVLVLQQFSVLVGFPIFNLSNYNLAEPWKLNALSAEPSHSARIMALLMYCFITIKELTTNRKYNFKFDIKKDKWVWIAFLWTMITMGSGMAFLIISIVLLKFISFRNLVPFFVIVGAILFLVSNFQTTAFERTYKTVFATATFNEEAIIQADHSASVRIVPFLILAKKVNVNSIDGWFGHGIDYVSSFLSENIPGVREGISGGGLFQLWIEYGFIPFALFFTFSLTNAYRKDDYLSILFWFMLVFLSSVNSQIVWLCLILLFTNKYFEKSLKN